MMSEEDHAGVAIVGIACRFPGAADHSAFWRNLCDGVESISALSDQELKDLIQQLTGEKSSGPDV